MDVMSRPVLTVRSGGTIEQAAFLLSTNNITSAPVLDSACDLVGMVSEGDLLIGREHGRIDARDGRVALRVPPMVVADVMTSDVIVTAPDADLADVAEALLYNDVHSVPVVDNTAELIGIVSRRDVLRALVHGDDTVQMEVQHRLDEYAVGERRWTASVADAVASISGHCTDRAEEKVVGVLVHTVPGVAAVQMHPST